MALYLARPRQRRGERRGALHRRRLAGRLMDDEEPPKELPDVPAPAAARDAAERAEAQGGPAPHVAKPVKARRINLALQGGGTHGAFTWGVLERLLEDDRLDIDGVSGTSAGGDQRRDPRAGPGRGRARRARSGRWSGCGATSRSSSPPARSRTRRSRRRSGATTSPIRSPTRPSTTLTRAFSPYQFNPFPIEYNPLRKVIADQLDLARAAARPEGG